MKKAFLVLMVLLMLMSVSTVGIAQGYYCSNAIEQTPIASNAQWHCFDDEIADVQRALYELMLRRCEQECCSIAKLLYMRYSAQQESQPLLAGDPEFCDELAFQERGPTCCHSMMLTRYVDRWFHARTLLSDGRWWCAFLEGVEFVRCVTCRTEHSSRVVILAGCGLVCRLM